MSDGSINQRMEVDFVNDFSRDVVKALDVLIGQERDQLSELVVKRGSVEWDASSIQDYIEILERARGLAENLLNLGLTLKRWQKGEGSNFERLARFLRGKARMVALQNNMVQVHRELDGLLRVDIAVKDELRCTLGS